MTSRVIRLTVLAIALGGVAFTAAAATVPLSPGEYVRSGVPCRDAPLAALLTYDGRSFAGAHASSCATTILSVHGRRYDLRSTCRAAGDGSSAPAYVETQVVIVRSSSRFTFTHRGGTGTLDRAEYRRCPR